MQSSLPMIDPVDEQVLHNVDDGFPGVVAPRCVCIINSWLSTTLI